MDRETRNLLAAGLAGVVIGAFSMASLMSTTMRRSVESATTALAAPRVDTPVSPALIDSARAFRPKPEATSGNAPVPLDPSVPTLSAGTGSLVSELRNRRLTLPVQGIDASRLTSTFNDVRGGGSRRHEAIDILAPRHTPVLAVEDGKLARLLSSAAGGLTIYQYDPDERFVYYYAHLERYADGLREGSLLRRGQVIGYVGTSGNAPPNTPHLHFSIVEMTEPKKWWQGRPIDPYDVFR